MTFVTPGGQFLSFTLKDFNGSVILLPDHRLVCSKFWDNIDGPSIEGRLISENHLNDHFLKRNLFDIPI